MNKYYDLYTQKFYKSPNKHTNCSKNYEQPSYDTESSSACNYDVSSLYVYSSRVDADFKDYPENSSKGCCSSSNIDKSSSECANGFKEPESYTYDNSYNNTCNNEYNDSYRDKNCTYNDCYAKVYNSDYVDSDNESESYSCNSNNAYAKNYCCDYDSGKEQMNYCNNSYIDQYSGECDDFSNESMNYSCNDSYESIYDNEHDNRSNDIQSCSCNNACTNICNREYNDSSYKESSNFSCKNSYVNTYNNECNNSYKESSNCCANSYVNENNCYQEPRNSTDHGYVENNTSLNNRLQEYPEQCRNDNYIDDKRGSIQCTQSYSDVSVACNDKEGESFYYEEHLKSDSQCNHISGNEVCECIKGNSLDVNVDKSDSDIRADLVLETKSIIRIWGQIKDCHGNTVGDAIVSLLKPGYIRGKLNYVCTATTVTDYMGFYQFELDNDYKDTVYRIIVSKPNK